MTIETNAETQEQTTTSDQSPGTEQVTTPSSTVPSASEPPATEPPATEPTAEETAASEAAAAEAAAAAASEEPAKDGADPYGFAEDEEGKKLKEFVGEKTPAQVAKELMNAQALLGKKSIGIPGKDSTPEEQRAFHKARGVPDDETGYDLTPAMDELKKIAPEGWNPSPELEASFRKAARLSNISNSEAQQFAQHYLGEQFKAREEFVKTEVQATKDAAALLAKTWGPDRSVGEANFARGMKAIGLPAESVDVFLAAYGGNGAARFNMVNAVAEIGRRYTEGGPVPGGQPNGEGSMTKEQARAEMERIKKDPVLAKAYTEVTDPRHQEISAEMARLGKIERGIKA